MDQKWKCIERDKNVLWEVLIPFWILSNKKFTFVKLV